MRISINTGAENNCVQEYFLIELQGDLESHGDSPKDSQFVGDLHFTHENTPILIIGHHILHGKEQKLEKPFILLDKSTDESLSIGATKDYRVKAVIKKKIIFKTRPKPIIKGSEI